MHLEAGAVRVLNTLLELLILSGTLFEGIFGNIGFGTFLLFRVDLKL